MAGRAVRRPDPARKGRPLSRKTPRAQGAGHWKGRYHHPLVGDLALEFEVLRVVDEPEQYLVVYSPEPASPSAETLALPGSWTGTAAAELPGR